MDACVCMVSCGNFGHYYRGAGPLSARHGLIEVDVSCWAVVAINTRFRRKGRLRGALDAADRELLARGMLDKVLSAASDARSVAHVLIVSPDEQGLPAGYEVLHDAGAGLNDAFELALAHGRGRAREFVLLPADLPRLTASDIDALVHEGRRARIAIAPDRRHTGTNGLYLGAALDFRCRFGGASRARHEAEARRLGVEPAIVMRPGLASDLDTPADLRLLSRRGASRASNAVCAERPA
jgi:2-phospho-L-lactate guanylyltransferase